MKHDHNCLSTVLTSLIFKKGSKTENMKAKDHIGIFYITEDHEDGIKKIARCFFVSAESERLKAYHLKCFAT